MNMTLREAAALCERVTMHEHDLPRRIQWDRWQAECEAEHENGHHKIGAQPGPLSSCPACIMVEAKKVVDRS